MLRVLHQLSAFCFLILGASFFLAWVFVKNGIWGTESAVWLQVADLPLLFSGAIYGGMSLYKSLLQPERTPKILPWMIGVPLAVFFVLVLVMNFWQS
ncbi:hypothetical protein EXS70_05025 [Candidatus Peribacteria bacterium]|nr:hypothetical protein [Candidatus Peribacteria bacterium]